MQTSSYVDTSAKKTRTVVGTERAWRAGAMLACLCMLIVHRQRKKTIQDAPWAPFTAVHPAVGFPFGVHFVRWTVAMLATFICIMWPTRLVRICHVTNTSDIDTGKYQVCRSSHIPIRMYWRSKVQHTISLSWNHRPQRMWRIIPHSVDGSCLWILVENHDSVPTPHPVTPFSLCPTCLTLPTRQWALGMPFKFLY